MRVVGEVSPPAEFTRRSPVASPVRSHPPEFFDWPAGADRADADLAAAGVEVDRAVSLSG
ncbi:hypothetical protein GCM10010412_043630 [Nonomuraea recticatena]|uniref:Uncharacterized protein n=1 Tax=Nonomuraea recticatena TaxID=46178 RepID=A0ABN3S2R5_9ACTN